MVQSHLRGLKLPVPADEGLLLGFDSSGVATAAHFGFDDRHEQFMIWAVACSIRCQGEGHGKETIGAVLSVLKATKDRYSLDCGVFTHIDPRNLASRAVFASAGFEFLDVYEGYEGWVRDI
jgi:RimJ/RimL family protein N-acetyltransferase